MTDLLCSCISLHLALPGVPWVPLGKWLLCPAGLGMGTTKGCRSPPLPCELCLSLIPVNQACRLCASRLFDYNYHPLLYTGHESPEQLRAPSRRAPTNNERETIPAQSRKTCKGQEKPFLEDKHRAAKLSSRIRQGLEFAAVVESAQKTTGSSPGERAAHKLSLLRDSKLKPSL